MAPVVKGSASYKKKDGTLNISGDNTCLAWYAHGDRDNEKAVMIMVANITNLQQTPESAPKVMLKIFEKTPDIPEPVVHLFHFNSTTNARGEANNIKGALTSLISALKAGDASVPRPNGTSSSGAMAMAGAANSKPDTSASRWYDDALLKTDIELQQSLMKKDPILQKTYMEARRTKPDSISDSHFNSQFWSTRTNLLRSYAVESTQKRGAYNVLSAVKPRQVDGELKMNLTVDQVQLIFSQHPLVKRVYDENVPKLNEMDFWSRFFLSRLFKKLKGERIVEADSTDPTFDRYLNLNDDEGLNQRLLDTYIPNLIDLEANEENQGGTKSGNRKDYTMIPAPSSKVPIIRTLNSLSEKIMAHVAPADGDRSDPGRIDEAYNELVLRDLRGDAEENRIMLNIKEQSRFFSSDKPTVSEEAAKYAKQVPSEVLFDMQMDVDPSVMDTDATGGLDLRKAIGVLEESDDDVEEKKPHVGSKASMSNARKQILEDIATRRAELDGTDAESSLCGLSQTIFDRVRLTHATTIEFLHHFWHLFLSGDAERAGELAKQVETLNRAMDRINAVAADAEKERAAIIAKEKQHVKEVFEQTRRRIHWKQESVGGGESVVKEMMASVIRSLQKASTEYKKALAAEGMDVTAN